MYTVKTISALRSFESPRTCFICNQPIPAEALSAVFVARNHDTKDDEYGTVCEGCTNQGKDFIEQVLNHHQ